MTRTFWNVARKVFNRAAETREQEETEVSARVRRVYRRVVGEGFVRKDKAGEEDDFHLRGDDSSYRQECVFYREMVFEYVEEKLKEELYDRLISLYEPNSTEEDNLKDYKRIYQIRDILEIDINKKKGAGRGKITWPYYWEINRILQALPVNDASLLHETACSDSSEVEQMIRAMEMGSTCEQADDVLEGDKVSVQVTDPTAKQATGASSSPTEGADGLTRATPAAEKTLQQQSNKKQSPQQMLMSELIEEQRQLHVSLGRSNNKELQLREVQQKLNHRVGDHQEGHIF
ncbi:hypothetical protein HPB51_000250 [Rhipicephalus microplus]|uniref:Uncharacterized protein n=1 Tax=Rhipicephalus microplus TaxID=6941 RepID=A0A9J6D449_RHIMP|nr:hypothetical protein HPB51_000250 [Rhipicephalus microplus]